MQIVEQPTEPLYIEKNTSRGSMTVTHYHETYEMYFLLHGKREYFIENSFYKIEEGDVVFIPKSALHRTAGRAGERILVYFSDELLKKYFSSNVLDALSLGAPAVYRAAESSETFMSDLSGMYEAYKTHSAGDEKGEALFVGYLFRILFAISTRRNCYTQSDYSDGRIESIIRYINENYAGIDGLDELAGRFFISKYHFCRLFHKNLGVSVTAYLNTIKVRAACELLAREKTSLTEIATHVGFNSVSYFCKVFKSEMGISPSAYRKKYA